MSVLRQSLRASLPAIAIATVVYLCFMHKAFNIDDVTFLTMAKHMLVDPLHPASTTIVINGRPPAWISAGMWSGPVMPAMLVPAVAMGGAEWLAHLVMLVVFLIGVVSTAGIALRLGASLGAARWAALLMTTSAAVIAMAMTNMPDIPTMSFAALGAERLLAFRQLGGWWRATAAALALALSVLSRQHGGLVFPCLLLMTLPAWPRSVREFLDQVRSRAVLSTVAIMAAAVALVFALYALMRDPYAGGGLATTPMRVSDFSLWHANLPNVPVQWMLTFPLGLAWLWMHGRRMTRSWWCWLALPVGVWLAYQTHVFHRRLDWMPWQAPITALGTAVLIDIVVDAVRRRDIVDLGLAAWLFIMVPMAVYTHLPPKYFVPSAPAMAVLLVRSCERLACRPRIAFGTVAATGLVLGVLVIRADAVLAEVGRKGGEVVATYVARGERVWFDGAWAFHWYAEQAGARPVTTEAPQPGPGDIVVVGLEGWVIKKWPNKQLVERQTFDEPGGRILQRPAGFFSNVAWGPLPWVWSKRAHDPIEVWRIE